MRIAELNLIAYGKFTDHKLLFPKAAHDFHVIIGPNEAGKSTVRRAIAELLFGMERQSPLGFKHPQSDLRLSAVLEKENAVLKFMRSKQQKSLRSMNDEPLPETFLASVLGSLTGEAFSQLHCLDHERLLKGGQGIVDPRNSVSQILFQAASGMDGFASVRDELAKRANELFANRGRSNDYSQAAERYALAQKSLRDAQVRTKEWLETRDALRNANEALDKERLTRREQESQRATLERARRISPLIGRLRRLEQELADLGHTLALPLSAKETLESGISSMNAAAGIVATRESDVVAREGELEGIVVDYNVLQHGPEIERLANLCGLYANHPRDLVLRQHEVNQWLKEILNRSTEFSWGTSEEEVRGNVPEERVLRTIDALLKERGALTSDERAANDSVKERQSTIDELQDQLAATPGALDHPQLAQALEQALPYKTSDAKKKALQSAVTLAEAAAKRSIAALGRPEIREESLREMQLPSLERISGYRARRKEIAKAADFAKSLAQQANEQILDVQLQISQFVRSHKVVTVDEVSKARLMRDEKWNAIKDGASEVKEVAPQLDLAIRLADELADSRTTSETDGATLQALRDRLEKATGEHERNQLSVESRMLELNEFDRDWANEAEKIGLPEMQLDDLPEWISKRETALQAVEALANKRNDYEQECASAAQARDDLINSMLGAGIAVDRSLGLGALCAVADGYIRDVQKAQARHDAVHQQLIAARSALKVARETSEEKITAVREWESRWERALSQAHLVGVRNDIAEIESAVDAARFIRQLLEKIDSHRSERIEAMEGDLKELNDVSEKLVQEIAPDLAQSSPPEVARILTSKLEEARRQSSRKTQTQEFLDGAKRQLAEARSTVDQVKATLKPLLTAAGVDDPISALPLVEKAQRRTELVKSISDTRSEVEASADGLSLEQVETEVAMYPATDVPQLLAALNDALGDSERNLTRLAQAQLEAQQAFDAVDGGDSAAIAEAQKQEALADMSEASEEFVRLATANSLLKWAVDKYRDRKQGPLLNHASSIFRDLTLGSFEKLRIDYEDVPPSLLAYRGNGQAVKVSGLSDGTRDQLFLALRIAALELQAEQGTPVPFVADDLFINFDDRRSQAGLRALYALSQSTQVLFLSHQEHLCPVVERLFPGANVITLETEGAGG